MPKWGDDPRQYLEAHHHKAVSLADA